MGQRNLIGLVEDIYMIFYIQQEVKGKKLLDFGPGDGWPSLIIAPFVRKVFGLDSLYSRVETCTENTKRLGINNAEFKCYPAGDKIPFDNNTFDGSIFYRTNP